MASGGPSGSPTRVFRRGTHLGAGFPFASHSIRMLSRGSTMWSFTDCLVMVGGWDTATGQIAGGQVRRQEPAGPWLGERPEVRASGTTQKSKQAGWAGPHQRPRGRGAGQTPIKNPFTMSPYPREKRKARLLCDPLSAQCLVQRQCLWNEHRNRKSS